MSPLSHSTVTLTRFPSRPLSQSIAHVEINFRVARKQLRFALLDCSQHDAHSVTR